MEFMQKNDLIPLFINAGHTDIRQECDCVMNKPLKHNFTNAFKLNKYLLQHANNTSNEMPPFMMDLRESIIKPLIPKCAVYALSFLQTEAFRGIIRSSFLKDGLLQDARDPNTYSKPLTTDYIINTISSPAFNIISEEEREEDFGLVNIQNGEDSADILTLEALTISGKCDDDEHIDTPANNVLLSAIDLALDNAADSTSGDVLVASTASPVSSTIDIAPTDEAVSVSVDIFAATADTVIISDIDSVALNVTDVATENITGKRRPRKINSLIGELKPSKYSKM